MTEQEAQEIVVLIKAATAARVEQSTEHYFQVALHHLNYESALSAATIGTVTWRRFPSWADFKEIYRAQERLREPVGEQRSYVAPNADTDDDQGKRGDHAPEWIHVWSWCRLARTPRNYRYFPQQDGHVDSTMTTEEYEELRVEWEAAGSPKSDNPLPMARG